MTAPLTQKPATSPTAPTQTRVSDELASLRASVNKLARAQSALVLNVKALTDQVKMLSDIVQHMSKTMNPRAAEDEARNQLH
jgi:tetrahydromethanopterin S-methyltransferase subunit B